MPRIVNSRAALVSQQGNILQVVQGTLGSTVTKTPPIDGTLDSGLSATIIPSSTTSKILVQ